MKQKKSTRKYNIETSFSPSVLNQAQLSDTREQLRQALEQLEQHRLSSELETQKRVIAQQQCQMLKEQNQELRLEFDSIKRELSKFSKKYSKAKEQKACEKCRSDEQFRQKVEKEREIFLKQRAVLKNEIAQLKKTLDSITNPTQQSLHFIGGDNLKKQLLYKQRTIQDQKRIIRYLDQKLSSFQLQKLQTLNYVESIDQKLQQLQMQNLILRGKQRRDLSSPARRNGSIKNLQKLEKSRSRITKLSPNNY